MRYATNFRVSNAFLTDIMARTRLLLSALVACVATVAGRAQEAERPVTSVYQFEIGSGHVRDTYLTPLAYSGLHTGLSYGRMQAMKASPERWLQHLDVRAELGDAVNPAGNAHIYNLGVDAGWGAMYKFAPVGGVRLAVGPEAKLSAGVLYSTRNGNNPADARGSVTIGASGLAAYGVRLGRLPVTLSYRPSLQLIGAFFSPQYDELYYEIWLGNRSGLVHCAWPGSMLDFEHTLAADLHLGRWSLRLGYRGTVFSSRAADIVNRRLTHTLVVGIVCEWVSLRPSGL